MFPLLEGFPPIWFLPRPVLYTLHWRSTVPRTFFAAVPPTVGKEEVSNIAQLINKSTSCTTHLLYFFLCYQAPINILSGSEEEKKCLSPRGFLEASTSSSSSSSSFPFHTAREEGKRGERGEGGEESQKPVFFLLLRRHRQSGSGHPPLNSTLEAHHAPGSR